MNSTVSVSFIVPYYCVDDRLVKRCVDSVRALGDAVDWELWLIDDGTPDSHMEESLSALGDSRIRYYRQENGGLSAARNAGIMRATKEYIHFLDADDYVYVSGVMQCIKLLQRDRPDILVFRSRKTYRETLVCPSSRMRGRVLLRTTGAAYLCRHNLRASAWGYMACRHLVAGLRFREGIYHEDEEFTPRLFAVSGLVEETDALVYAYYQRTGSIINAVGRDHLFRRFGDLLAVVDSLCAYRESCRDVMQRRGLQRRIDQLSMDIVYRLLRESPDRDFFDRFADRLKKRGIFPVPVRAYTVKYLLFSLVVCSHPMLGLLYRLMKKRK